MKEKKVLVLLVEGPSDDASLTSIIKSLISPQDIRCHVIHGDITCRSTNANTTMRTIINNMVKDIINKYKIKKSDILMVAHFMDVDGVFVPNDVIIEKPCLDHYEYTLTNIKVPDLNEAIDRNDRKRRNMLLLSGMSSTYEGIPYQTFFFSRNLEHALHDISRNCTDDEKEQLADDFNDKFIKNATDFLSFINNVPPAVPTKEYRSSWDYISQKGSLHSLERGSNLHILLDKLSTIGALNGPSHV